MGRKGREEEGRGGEERREEGRGRREKRGPGGRRSGETGPGARQLREPAGLLSRAPPNPPAAGCPEAPLRRRGGAPGSGGRAQGAPWLQGGGRSRPTGCASRPPGSGWCRAGADPAQGACAARCVDWSADRAGRGSGSPGVGVTVRGPAGEHAAGESASTGRPCTLGGWDRVEGHSGQGAGHLRPRSVCRRAFPEITGTGGRDVMQSRP